MIAIEPEKRKLVKLGEPNKNNIRIIKRHIFATVVICNYVIKYCYSLHFILQPLKMEPIEGSETSAIINQMPRNYPKGNLL